MFPDFPTVTGDHLYMCIGLPFVHVQPCLLTKLIQNLNVKHQTLSCGGVWRIIAAPIEKWHGVGGAMSAELSQSQSSAKPHPFQLYSFFSERPISRCLVLEQTSTKTVLKMLSLKGWLIVLVLVLLLAENGVLQKVS